MGDRRVDCGFIVGEREEYEKRKTRRERQKAGLWTYIQLVRQRERNSQPNRERSADESLSPETQLLTRKDGGIKRWRENENSGMRGWRRRNGQRDWEETGREGDEKSANRNLKPRFPAHWERTDPGRSVCPSRKLVFSLSFVFNASFCCFCYCLSVGQLFMCVALLLSL